MTLVIWDLLPVFQQMKSFQPFEIFSGATKYTYEQVYIFSFISKLVYLISPAAQSAGRVARVDCSFAFLQITFVASFLKLKFKRLFSCERGNNV